MNNINSSLVKSDKTTQNTNNRQAQGNRGSSISGFFQDAITTITSAFSIFKTPKTSFIFPYNWSLIQDVTPVVFKHLSKSPFTFKSFNCTCKAMYGLNKEQPHHFNLNDYTDDWAARDYKFVTVQNFKEFAAKLAKKFPNLSDDQIKFAMRRDLLKHHPLTFDVLYADALERYNKNPTVENEQAFQFYKELWNHPKGDQNVSAMGRYTRMEAILNHK